MAETAREREALRIGIARHPLTSILLPVPIVCFVGALLTDLAYTGSGGNLVWLDFSNWLIFFGLVVGAIAAIILLIHFVRSGPVRNSGGRTQLLFFYAALLVELFNAFVHDRDGWTAVAGTGMILSVVGALLVLIAGWLHRTAAAEAVS